MATDEKSNEITAIPELLRLVDLDGAIITIDAMGTQTNIATRIVEGRGDYVLQLKGNQESAHEFVKDYFRQGLESDFSGLAARQYTTSETGHVRQEQRTYIHLPAPREMPGFEKWAGLRTIGMVIAICQRDGKETIDARYF